MTSREYNERVAAVARNQPLQGYTRRGGGSSQHHWPISFRQTAEPSRRWWAIFVGPGAVNEHVAGISYLRTGDPRGWVMPPDHPGIALATKLYGPAFELIDRRLTERVDPPHILVQAPAEVAGELSDFEPVPEADRLPLPFFRTARMWELELYRAVVFLTAQPRAYSRAETIYNLPIVARPSRFRIGVAPRMPVPQIGTSLGGLKLLAELYLTRDPRSPQPLLTDTLYARERCFWSLCTANAEPNPFGLQNPFDPLSSDGIAIAQILSDVLAAIGANLESASSVEFWTAA